jgi:hypothetical protein
MRRAAASANGAGGELRKSNGPKSVSPMRAEGPPAYQTRLYYMTKISLPLAWLDYLSHRVLGVF